MNLGIIELARKEKRNLTQAEAYELLAEYGIPVPKYLIAHTPKEATKVSNKLGFPLVMKIISPDVMHKTDIGGIEMDVSNSIEVKKNFLNIICRVKEKKPDAKIKGVLLYKQAPAGIEVIIGMNRDPQFGPTIMFGLGGILTEILEDVSFRVCPVNKADISEMINEIKGKKLLTGYRGKPNCDINTIRHIIMRVCRLSLDYPDIMGIDLNPIIIYAKSALVVDSKVFLNNS